MGAHMNLPSISQVLLFLVFFLPTANASDYTVILPYDHEQSQMDLMEATFVSTIEDELAQFGFRVFNDKAAASNPKRTLSMIAKIEQTDVHTITPTLRAIDLSSGQRIASLRGYSIQKLGLDKNHIIQKLEGSAAVLVRQMTRRLYQQNWANIDKQNLTWETDLGKLKLRFYSFNSCYINYVADVIETEFPGTVSLSLSKETNSKAEFILTTTAKTQFLSKWLRTLLIEEGFLQGEHYTLNSKSRFFDIRLHPHSSLNGSYC
jgi:hypothetical protein